MTFLDEWCSYLTSRAQFFMNIRMCDAVPQCVSRPSASTRKLAVRAVRGECAHSSPHYRLSPRTSGSLRCVFNPHCAYVCTCDRVCTTRGTSAHVPHARSRRASRRPVIIVDVGPPLATFRSFRETHTRCMPQPKFLKPLSHNLVYLSTVRS